MAKRRVLGLFPSQEITPTAPEFVAAVRENTRSVVLSGRAPSDVPVGDAVLAALAAT